MKISSIYIMPYDNINFKSHSWPQPDLKQMWDRGQLPTVKYGFYGDLLKPENITREHLKPASKGGTKKFGNIVLASRMKNGARSNYDIKLFFNLDNAKRYFNQFININLKNFNGKKYIEACKKTLKALGCPPF